MEIPQLFRTPADVSTFVAQVGLDATDRAAIARGRHMLDEQADAVQGWWLALAQDGPGRNVMPQTASGDVDHAALEAARPYLRAWVAETSEAGYDEAWLARQRRVATQLARAPHERGRGPDGWMALLPFFAMVVEGLPRIVSGVAPDRLAALQAAWRKAMQIHLTAWVTAAS